MLPPFWSPGAAEGPPRTDESITVAKKVAGTLRVPFSAHGVCGLLWKTRPLLIRRSLAAPCYGDYVWNRSIQQHALDFQPDFADSCHHSPQRPDHRLVASHPAQGQRVTPPVPHNTGRGVGVKLGGPLLRLAVVEFVATLLRLPIVRRASASRSRFPTPDVAWPAAAVRSRHRSNTAPRPATSWASRIPRPS
jgi:hypothetical protein